VCVCTCVCACVIVHTLFHQCGRTRGRSFESGNTIEANQAGRSTGWMIAAQPLSAHKLAATYQLHINFIICSQNHLHCLGTRLPWNLKPSKVQMSYSIEHTIHTLENRQTQLILDHIKIHTLLTTKYGQLCTLNSRHITVGRMIVVAYSKINAT